MVIKSKVIRRQVSVALVVYLLILMHFHQTPLLLLLQTCLLQPHTTFSLNSRILISPASFFLECTFLIQTLYGLIEHRGSNGVQTFKVKVMSTMELPPYSSQSGHVTAASHGCSKASLGWVHEAED